MGCELIKICVLFILSFLLFISVVSAAATIELSSFNPNPGDSLKITVKAGVSGYLSKLYFYDKLNNLVDVKELVCENGKRICYSSQIFNYVIPSTWEGDYYVAVYDYDLHDYVKKIFSVGAVSSLNKYVGATSSSVSYTFPRGWSMISLPLQPDDPRPGSVFNVNDIDMNLHKYDVGLGAYVTYNRFTPSKFGNMTVEDGYWLSCLNSAGCTASYSGSDAPGLIPLYMAGWYMIGVPSQVDVYVNDIQVEHNGITKSIIDASTGSDKWIELPFRLYNQESGYLTIGPAGMGTIWDDNYLYPWMGYWIHILVDDVTLKWGEVVPGGVIITNTATATYRDTSGTQYTATSNTVEVEVTG